MRLLMAIGRLWRRKRRARRRAVLGCLRILPWLAIGIPLTLWAVTEPHSPDTDSSNIYCRYSEQQDNSANVASTPVLDCQQHHINAPEYEAYTKAKNGNIGSVVPAVRHWVAGVFGDPVSFFTFVLAASTIGLWLSTKRLWQGAEKQSKDFQISLMHAKTSANAAEKSANVAIVGQRPWVKIDIALTGSLVFESDVLRLPLDITLKNVGNTPAISTMPWIDFSPPRGNFIPPHWFDGIRIQRERTAHYGEPIGFSGVMAKHGTTLFPRQKHQIPWQARINKRDLEIAYANYPALPHGTSELILSGIVTYEFPGGRGETPFAFLVKRRDDENRNCLISLSDCPVPPERLHLEQLWLGPQAT